MSDTRKSILFIVNPVSGIGKHKGVERLIEDGLDKTQFNPRIVYTSGPGDATDISSKAAAEGIEIIVAVGGDGTVNETAAGLVGTASAMAIVPAGSGNGLARHLGIPMNLKRAIDIINTGRIIKIDTATINDQLFVNVAGVGFDASVAKKFAVAGKRGFSTYLRITTSSYKDYEPKQYTRSLTVKYTNEGRC
jgi:diacylglycerol kinase family enzyme